MVSNDSELNFEIGFKIDGKKVRNNSIDFSLFNQKYSALNRIITNLFKIDSIKTIKNQLKLNNEDISLRIKHVGSGSFKAMFKFVPCPTENLYNHIRTEGLPPPFDQLERELSFIIERTPTITREEYIEHFPDQRIRYSLLLSTRDLCGDDSHDFEWTITSPRGKKTLVFDRSIKERVDKLIENEEISIPKLAGEYNGCIFRNGKGTFQITLLNGELVKCNIDQEQFDTMVSELKIGDLVRVVGTYTREPNSREAKIEDLADIHNINDEFKKTYEEFKKDFEGIPDITEQDIKDLYETMVQNYSAFLLMGEE